MNDAARDALVAFGFEGATLTPIDIGLINVTFEVDLGDTRYILQRLNPIFSAKVHEDIDAVTTHLASKGLTTPRLVKTKSGAKWVEQNDGVWRVLTFVDGVTLDRIQDTGHASEAGALLGRFHRAVGDLDHRFESQRLGVHDTPKHLEALRRAVDTHREHRLHREVAPLADHIFNRFAEIGALPPLGDRVVHGDPKVSNIIFDEAGGARCLVDLDTLARMPIVLELGDAFRSWCNPGGEDRGEASFSLSLFEAAVRGYADGVSGLLDKAEIGAIVMATQTILLELGARFLADALVESYFGFDQSRFATRGDHNLLRGRRQLEVESALADDQDAAQDVVSSAFGIS